MNYTSIIISGLPLSGKSTLAKSLSETLNWDVHSIGSIFKKRWETIYPNKDIPFDEYWRNTSIEENKKVDEETKELFANKNMIGDFRYSFLYNDSKTLLVLVTADLKTRLERATQSGRYNGKSPEDIIRLLEKREHDEIIKAKSLYGEDYDHRDPKNYHLTIDFGKTSMEDAINIIKKKIHQPKVYFACSIAGGRDHAHLYPEIIDHLKKHAEVLTEIFSDDKIFELDSQIPDHEIFQRDMAWISDSHVIVAEVSTPSLGVGFEIATALSQGKKVLCLFKNQDSRKLSAMISGNKDLHVAKYNNIEEAKQRIDEFFLNNR